jgi:DNA-binding LytR/AlgR family response regulator
VDAFEAGAVDYLLKPVDAGRLTKAIERIRAKLAQPPSDMAAILSQLKAAVPAQAQERLKWIKASVGKQIKLIHVDDVLFFQSDTKYTRVVLADSEALIRTPLKDLLGGLDPERFWQIHRGTMVNVHAIAAAERIDAERMQVLVKGCSEKLPVSRSFTHLFRE